MHCPYCGKDKIRVIDSRECEDGQAIRRRRVCETQGCRKRFTTYERIEETHRLTVVKKDGKRVPWDRQKVLNGLERACYKRPVAVEDQQRIVAEVEEEIFNAFDKEVPSATIGQAVIERLRRVDQVAYVRFASVYRQFKTLDDLVAEARAVLDLQHYDVPGQGRLFIDPGSTGPLVVKPPEAAPAKARGRKPRPAAAAESGYGNGAPPPPHPADG